MITITETMTNSINHELLITSDKKYISNGEYWIHTDYSDNNENYKIGIPFTLFDKYTTMLFNREHKTTQIQFSEEYIKVTIHNDQCDEEIIVFEAKETKDKNNPIILYPFKSIYAENIILPLIRKGYKTYAEINNINKNNESESVLYIYDDKDTLVAIINSYTDDYSSITIQFDKI